MFMQKEKLHLKLIINTEKLRYPILSLVQTHT